MDPQAGVPKAALSSISYSQYTLLDVNGDLAEVHFDDAVPLAQFIDSNDIVHQYGTLSECDGLLLLPGETDPLAEYDVASEESKKVARSMLKSIWMNFLDGICFSDFDGENILVSRTGRVRFRNVSIIRNLPQDQLAEYTRNNFRSAGAVIAHDLFSSAPPCDIQHLLASIQKYEAKELIHMHPALLPVSSYPGFYKEMYDYISFSLPKPDLREVLLAMPRRYFEEHGGSPGWKTEVATNILLEKCMLYSPKSYEVPVNKPTQTCLNAAQTLALSSLGLVRLPGQASLYEDQKVLIRRLHFLTFMRNRSAHRLESLEWWIEQGNQAFNSQASELISHVHFPRVLAELQLLLYRIGKHKMITMDKYF